MSGNMHNKQTYRKGKLDYSWQLDDMAYLKEPYTRALQPSVEDVPDIINYACNIRQQVEVLTAVEHSAKSPLG